MSSDLPHSADVNDDSAADDSATHEELSLDQLSQAYAQVMKEQGHQAESDVETVAHDSLLPAIDEEVEPEPESQPIQTRSLDQMDADDNSGCPISPQSIVEAILFVGAPTGVKLTGRKLAAVMRDVSPKEIKKIVKQLNTEYEQNDCPFRIVADAGEYQMQLQEEMVEVQNLFFGRNRPTRLNQNAIDVLAIVAYNQPLSRSQVDKIRTRPSGTVLAQLLRRDLIVPDDDAKKKETLFRTTDRFLDLFGLDSLNDLPQTSAVSDLEELTDQ